MTRTAIALTVAIMALTLAVPAAQAAPEPTLSDVAGCNEQAAQITGGSALPHQNGRTPGTPREPSAPPGADATRPDVPRGPGDRGVGADPRDGVSTPLPGTGAPGERTDPSGSVITETPDPLLKGMDATRVDDPLYRAAYRDCMRARLGAR